MPSWKKYALSLARFCGLFLVPGIAAIFLAMLNPSTVSAQGPEFDFSPYHFQNVVIGGGGGFIPGIIFSNKEPGLVYIRTDIGGAYRFDQDKDRWVPLLDWVDYPNWNLFGVESIAIDPVDPQRVYLAVGTYTNEWTTQNGAIFRSDDKGRHFQRFDLPFKVGSNMPGRGMGERLAVDPNNNHILYLGTRSGNGLWRSNDRGRLWSKVSNFTDTGSYHEPSSGSTDTYDNDPIGVVWVIFDPRTTIQIGNTTVSKNIYVGVADPSSSLWQSNDGGQTWSAVAGQPTGVMPHHGKLTPAGVLYLSYNNNAGPFDGSAGSVKKYDTGSATWTDITPPTSPLSGGYGFGGLTFDAQNPNTIVVATLNQWWPDTQIFRSLDGGSTWSDIWGLDWSPGWPPYLVPSYTMDYTTVAPWLTFGYTPATCASGGTSNSSCPQPTPKLGWMVESIEIDPFDSNHLLYGTGATLYGTNNLTTWDSGGKATISVAAKGVEETAVLDLISPPTGTAHLISAVGDIGGFTHNDLKTPSVMSSNPVFTTGTSLDYAELAPSFVVRVGTGGTNGINIGFSTDGGQSWTPAATIPSGASGGTVAAAADASRVVWSTSAGVYYSADKGTTWMASTVVPASASVRADRVNPLKFYAYSAGTFYISIDGGATFTASAASNLPTTSAQFKATPGHEGDIWLAGGSTTTVYGIWHSRDGGNSFVKLWNVDAASTIGFGKPAPFHRYPALYSSAEVFGQWGIYRSDDAGFTWIRVNDDRHQYGQTNDAITGDPRIYGRVYFSTNGRGIAYGDPVDGRR
jgi:hypothetical protein